MHRLTFFLLGIFGSLLPALTFATTYGPFVIDIAITPEEKVDVTEKLAADFGYEYKHGIYRDMPYRYKNLDGTFHRTAVSLQSATRDGMAETVKKIRNANNLRFRLGKEDETITGKKVYTLRYQVTGALTHVGAVDELNWNVVGPDWEGAISEVSGQISLPQLPNLRAQQVACYVGTVGSTNQSGCTAEITNPTTVTYLVDQPINPGEAVTVNVGYTPGIVPILKVPHPIVSGTNWPAALVVLAILGSILHFTTRRIPKRSPNVKAIMPIYEAPHDLKPAELGVAQDMRAHTLDISATIVDLARRGYLQIEKTEKKFLGLGSTDYTLIRLPEPATDTPEPFAPTLLPGLFRPNTSLLDLMKKLTPGKESKDNGPLNDRVRLSELVNEFAPTLAIAQQQLTQQLIDKGYTRKHGTTHKYLLIVGGAIVAGLGAMLAANEVLTDQYRLTFSIPLALVGIWAIFIGSNVAERTIQGEALEYETKGYKLFLANTEKYRQPRR